ncbi:hypothetical protein KOR42_09720 [Thalassoglobus neptunius]|uniref:Uncharacterized protein n=1 Tax=Thalassoglobus neptunius TaxID=1938619 RepID=A0A5C5X417_9PLAN|nr:hypothetical protein [Thalassoglobus neptunius]TWT57610.1 hypothetical protein KOR42_09720 [Thalassoglobus neptunius]
MTTRFPGSSRRSGSPRRNGGTWVALIALLLIAGSLIGITSLIMPQILGLVLVVAGFLFFIVLHYFTWGQWLTRYLEENSQEDE